MSDLRIGDRERTAAVERLSAHAAAGRLSVEELERRVERAQAAVFDRDLLALEADLPGRRPQRVAGTRPRPPVPPAAVAALVAGIVLTALIGHPVVPLFVLAVILATRRARAWT